MMKRISIILILFTLNLYAIPNSNYLSPVPEAPGKELGYPHTAREDFSVTNKNTDENLNPSEIVITEVDHMDLPHFKIQTPVATYYISKESGGCSSMIDNDGNDWIDNSRTGDNPTYNSADSDYRGMPNLVFQGEDDGVGHPSGLGKCTTTKTSPDQLNVKSNSGNWEFTWTFYSDYAVIDVVKIDSTQNYWFLYEGPIAGNFHPSTHYWATDKNEPTKELPVIGKSPINGNWQWACFGDENIDRTLFVSMTEQDDLNDFLAYMGNNKNLGLESPDGMTVFGFGRSAATPLINKPNSFLVGFFEQNTFTTEGYNSISLFLDNTISKHTQHTGDLELQRFQHNIVDSTLSGRVAIGDIDNDGYNDVIVHTWGNCRGFQPDGNLFWYKYPDWEKHTVQSNRKFFGDEIVAFDLDNDGDTDIIAPIGQATTANTCEGSDRRFYGEIYWYENIDGKGTEWKEHLIGLVDNLSEIKDIHIHDMDNDGKVDIAVRASENIVIFYQEDITTWVKHMTSIAKREGSCLADIDGDGYMDFVANGFWLRNPGQRTDAWARYNIDALWYSSPTVAPPVNDKWRNDAVRVLAADFDGDGTDDLVFSHSEHKGFNVTWYKKTGDPITQQTEAWQKHEIGIVDFAHTLQVADFDMNGTMDIMVGATVWKGMLEGSYKPEAGDLVVFLNDGAGNFTRHQIDNKHIYAGIVGDIDNDGDMDIIGPRCWADDDTFDGDVTSVDIWRNLKIHDGKQELDQWTYKEVYNNRKRYDNSQKGAAFLFGLDFGDVNGDGLLDIVAGRELHIAPNDDINGEWTAINLPEPETMDAALFHDVNRDSRPDIIGFDLMASGTIFWLEATNQEGTNWQAHQITLSPAIPIPGHRNPQGYAIAKMMQDGEPVIVIEAGDNTTDDNGIFVIEMEFPATTWTTHKISDVSVGGNGLAVGDIDGDGNLDIFTGFKDLPRRMLDDRAPGPFPIYWLKNPGVYTDPWKATLVDTYPQEYMPDRFAIADIDNDSINDLILSEENYPVTGGLSAYWYKTPETPEMQDNWGEKQLIIDNGESFNSMDIIDMDGDGDNDVVIADMGLSKDGTLYIAENINDGEFIIHKIHEGVESHGLKAGDIDGDGDMDIVAIAWNKPVYQTLRLWINDFFKKKKMK